MSPSSLLTERRRSSKTPVSVIRPLSSSRTLALSKPTPKNPLRSSSSLRLSLRFAYRSPSLAHANTDSSSSAPSSVSPSRLSVPYSSLSHASSSLASTSREPVIPSPTPARRLRKKDALTRRTPLAAKAVSQKKPSSSASTINGRPSRAFTHILRPNEGGV